MEKYRCRFAYQASDRELEIDANSYSKAAQAFAQYTWTAYNMWEHHSSVWDSEYSVVVTHNTVQKFYEIEVEGIPNFVPHQIKDAASPWCDTGPSQ